MCHWLLYHCLLLLIIYSLSFNALVSGTVPDWSRKLDFNSLWNLSLTLNSSILCCSVVGRHLLLHLIGLIVPCIVPLSWIIWGYLQFCSEKYFLPMLIFFCRKNSPGSLPVSFLFYPSSGKSHLCSASSLAFFMQGYTRKQAESGLLVRLLLLSGPANLDSWAFYSTSDFIVQKQENSFTIFTAECPMGLHINTSPSSSSEKQDPISFRDFLWDA